MMGKLMDWFLHERELRHLHDRDLRHDRIKQGYFRPILEIQENRMKKKILLSYFLNNRLKIYLLPKIMKLLCVLYCRKAAWSNKLEGSRKFSNFIIRWEMLLRHSNIIRGNFFIKPQNKLFLPTILHRRVGPYCKTDAFVFFIEEVIMIRNV